MKQQILMFIWWLVIMIIRTICLIIITKCIWYDYKTSKKDQDLQENQEKRLESEEKIMTQNERISQMSLEEMEIICDKQVSCKNCPLALPQVFDDTCILDIKQWLESEVKEDER
jgi:hypothetical protein